MIIPQHEKELIDQYSEQFQIFRNEIMSDEAYQAIYESTPYQNWRHSTQGQPSFITQKMKEEREKLLMEAFNPPDEIKPFHPAVSFLIWTGITIAVGSILTTLVCSAIFYIKALFV